MNVVLDEKAFMPTRAHETDAGADLYTPERIVLRSHDSVTVDTGVHFEIPAGMVGFVKSKSGLMCKNDILTDGTVDAGYTGSVCVHLINHSGKTHIFEAGDKIAQIVFQYVELPEFTEVKELAETSRGNGGFGSTGK
jgi:dUTP pyrophosphatase